MAESCSRWRDCVTMSDVTPLISPGLGLFSDLNINWRETLEIYLFLNTSPGQARPRTNKCLALILSQSLSHKTFSLSSRDQKWCNQLNTRQSFLPSRLCQHQENVTLLACLAKDDQSSVEKLSSSILKDIIKLYICT